MQVIVDYVQDLHQQIIQVDQHHQREHNIQEIQIAQSQQTISMMSDLVTMVQLRDSLMRWELVLQH